MAIGIGCTLPRVMSITGSALAPNEIVATMSAAINPVTRIMTFSPSCRTRTPDVVESSCIAVGLADSLTLIMASFHRRRKRRQAHMVRCVEDQNDGLPMPPGGQLQGT